MSELPGGTVTFLLTDLEGSTQLWEKHPEAMKAALAKHDSILREAIESNNGHTIKTTGDGIHAAFRTAVDAVYATLAGQRALQSILLSENPVLPLRARMGLHTGEAEIREGDYYGQALNRTARLMAAGHGGQILLSRITAELVRDQLPDEVTLVDLGDHRLKDLIQPEHVFQLTAPGLVYEFPPLKSLNAIANNLPLQLTSFIGRERELDELSHILPREGTRLLTLIGPGGTGKTRLSLQLAAEHVAEFKDGVWLVELAPLAEPDLILQSLASVLNLREQAGMPLIDIVLNYLRSKELLLILDNCEHLVEACAALAEQFLQNSPELKILASSREALGISGETIYRVPSLSLPDGNNVSAEGISRSEAARLFMERAIATNPRFSLSENNAPFIAQICRRLDGIPLALELAAARTSVFSPEQIAGRLDDRFRLLTGGSRTALPRQQTLRALIDWSYDVLPDGECKLLRRLSVFMGGWTFEAAEELCPTLDVLDLLPQLVNKSLVVVEEDRETTRYRLLETIRQYARDKLLEVGEAEDTRNRHLAYFLRFVEMAEPKLRSDEALHWIYRLEADHDNIRAAIGWGLDNDIKASFRIMAAINDFWFRRGYETEGRRMIEEALERVRRLSNGEDGDWGEYKRYVMKAYQGIGFLAFSQGDPVRAVEAGKRCAALARELGDDETLSIMLAFSASGRLMSSSLEEIDPLIQEAIAAANRSGNKSALGMGLGMLASRMVGRPEYEETAKAYQAEAEALLRATGNRFGFFMMRFGIAMGLRLQGRFDEARTQFAELYPSFLEMGDRHRANMVRSEIGHMDRYQGRFTEAELAYKEAIVEWERLGHRAAVAHQLECFAFLAQRSYRGIRAARLFGAAEALRERIDIAMTGIERSEYEEQVASLRAELGDAAFKSAWADGRTLSMEQAIAEALE